VVGASFTSLGLTQASGLARFTAPPLPAGPARTALGSGGGPLERDEAVYLCCTFPEVAFGGRYPLSLPCGARTFLTAGLSASPRDRLFYSPHYFTGARGGCQRKFAARRAKYVCHPAAEVL